MHFESVLAAHKRNVSEEVCQTLMNSYTRFVTLSERAGMPKIPKCHLMMHMLQRAVKKGNPRWYSTYRDESLNGIIGKVAASVHPRVFAMSALTKIHIGERLAFKKALRKIRGDD